MTEMEQIEKAAAEAVKVIANAAEQAAHVIASAAAEAVKVANVQTNLDHDLLIRLGEKMENLKDAIAELKSGTSDKISSLETRMKLTEDETTKNTNKISNFWIAFTIYTAIGVTLAGLIIYHMANIIK